MGQMCHDSYLLVVSVTAWRSFIQIYRRTSGHRRETFISTENDKLPSASTKTHICDLLL